jgi:uncharacterized RDD family membrane protein YckC
MTEWYYSDAQRRQHGPVNADTLAALHAAGTLSPDSLVWREGLSEWRPWREMIAEVMSAAPLAAPQEPALPAPDALAELAPTAARRDPWLADPQSDPLSAPLADVSPYAPPTARVEEDQGAVIRGGKVVYAGFWKRFAAYCIDYVVVVALTYAIMIPVALIGAIGIGATASGDNPVASGVGIALLGFGYLLSFLLPLLYFVWMHSSRHQATLGKLAVGIKVVRTDGTRIGFWRAFGRIFATILSTLILFIGWLMAGFTQQKQALHDMVCDTLVVDKWAFTEHPEWQQEGLGTVTIVILVLAGLAVFGFLAMFAVIGAIAGSGLN